MALPPAGPCRVHRRGARDSARTTGPAGRLCKPPEDQRTAGRTTLPAGPEKRRGSGRPHRGSQKRPRSRSAARLPTHVSTDPNASGAAPMSTASIQNAMDFDPRSCHRHPMTSCIAKATAQCSRTHSRCCSGSGPDIAKRKRALRMQSEDEIACPPGGPGRDEACVTPVGRHLVPDTACERTSRSLPAWCPRDPECVNEPPHRPRRRRSCCPRRTTTMDGASEEGQRRHRAELPIERSIADQPVEVRPVCRRDTWAAS
jgi:hypothetical protein